MKTTNLLPAAVSHFPVKRSYPSKPLKQNPIHKVKVVDALTARALLYSLFLNLREAIDQETLLDFRTNGTTTDVAFVIGTQEIKFNLKEA